MQRHHPNALLPGKALQLLLARAVNEVSTAYAEDTTGRCGASLRMSACATRTARVSRTSLKNGVSTARWCRGSTVGVRSRSCRIASCNSPSIRAGTRPARRKKGHAAWASMTSATRSTRLRGSSTSCKPSISARRTAKDGSTRRSPPAGQSHVPRARLPRQTRPGRPKTAYDYAVDRDQKALAWAIRALVQHVPAEEKVIPEPPKPPRKPSQRLTPEERAKTKGKPSWNGKPKRDWDGPDLPPK